MVITEKILYQADLLCQAEDIILQLEFIKATDPDYIRLNDKLAELYTDLQKSMISC